MTGDDITQAVASACKKGVAKTMKAARFFRQEQWKGKTIYFPTSEDDEAAEPGRFDKLPAGSVYPVITQEAVMQAVKSQGSLKQNWKEADEKHAEFAKSNSK